MFGKPAGFNFSAMSTAIMPARLLHRLKEVGGPLFIICMTNCWYAFLKLMIRAVISIRYYRSPSTPFATAVGVVYISLQHFLACWWCLGLEAVKYIWCNMTLRHGVESTAWQDSSRFGNPSRLCHETISCAAAHQTTIIYSICAPTSCSDYPRFTASTSESHHVHILM